MSNYSQETLLKYYLRELAYLRQQGEAFALRYPTLASRLDIGDHNSTDPHVERLLESFAFLAGRIQYNIEREFPEIPSALLGILYPQLQQPIPSMAIARFVVDPKQGNLDSGYHIPRHTPLYVQTESGPTARFRTCYPLTLWPLTVFAAQLVPTSPYGPLLWLRLAPQQGKKLRDLEVEQLRFHMQGSHALIGLLYELFVCHAQHVHLLPGYASSREREHEVRLTDTSKLPPDSLTPVGFAPEEALLPYPSQAHPGYRLLQEYFSLHKKFDFFDISNLALQRLGALFSLHLANFKVLFADDDAASVYLRHAFHNYGISLAEDVGIEQDKELENVWHVLETGEPTYRITKTETELLVHKNEDKEPDFLDFWIVFDRDAQVHLDEVRLRELTVDRTTFILGCTPIVNLFEQTTEPIRLDHTRSEYRLVADERQQSTTEIHSILDVVAVSQHGGETQTITPYYSLNHYTERRNQKAFWYARRLPAESYAYPGTEMFLSFVDLDFNPSLPAAQTVYARTLCTNRSLAEKLPPGTELQLDQGAPVSHILCLDKPTRQTSPPLQGATLWRLVSQLSLNHLSLSEQPQSLEALREVLKLYSGHDRATVDKRLRGIDAMSCRRVVRRLHNGPWDSFSRGMEITLTFDEEHFWGHSAILLASVLHYFFALYTAINTHTQLIARSKQREGVWKTWPPITGSLNVL